MGEHRIELLNDLLSSRWRYELGAASVSMTKLNVFTVRNLFGNAGRLKEVIPDLKVRKVLSRDAVPNADHLGWVLEDGECRSLVEAAYRYAAYTAGVTTVMCGTVDQSEMVQDIAFMEKGPLSEDTLRRLQGAFCRIAEPVGN